jgi:poly(3-hydroxybutyrate) depolymerase
MRHGFSYCVAALTSLVFFASPSDGKTLPACPEGFTPKAGLNTGFISDDIARAFIVVPPAKQTAPAPVWVPLTGSVEATNWNLFALRSGNNAKLADAGFMVIAPIRQCAKQDPDVSAGECNGPGHGGWNWNPWNDGRSAGVEGQRWANNSGADANFFKSMVRCVGTKWKLDSRRYFIGGISAGATMTNRALLFGSDFWAGGMPISGEWYATKDDGTPLSFDQGREAVAASPAKVFEGRVGPYPLPRRLYPMTIITVWGGDKDLWKCAGVLCADYRPSTQAASNYYSAQPDTVHVACSATHGHMWPQVNTDAFNLWALRTLSSRPKGSPRSAFRLTPPPPGYSCQIGRFMDHYQ